MKLRRSEEPATKPVAKVNTAPKRKSALGSGARVRTSKLDVEDFRDVVKTEPLDIHPPRPDNGEYKKLLAQTSPHFTLELDYGTFVWLWDFVEAKAAQSDAGNIPGSAEFTAVYGDMVRRARAEFRHAAAQHFKPVVKKAAEATDTKSATKPKKGKK